MCVRVCRNLAYATEMEKPDPDWTQVKGHRPQGRPSTLSPEAVDSIKAEFELTQGKLSVKRKRQLAAECKCTEGAVQSRFQRLVAEARAAGTLPAAKQTTTLSLEAVDSIKAEFELTQGVLSVKRARELAAECKCTEKAVESRFQRLVVEARAVGTLPAAKQTTTLTTQAVDSIKAEFELTQGKLSVKRKRELAAECKCTESAVQSRFYRLVVAARAAGTLPAATQAVDSIKAEFELTQGVLSVKRKRELAAECKCTESAVQSRFHRLVAAARAAGTLPAAKPRKRKAERAEEKETQPKKPKKPKKTPNRKKNATD